MIREFNWPITISILYIAIFIFTSLYLIIKDDVPTLFMLVLAVLWPLTLYFICLTKLLEIKDDTRKYKTSKTRNFFKDTEEGRAFAKKHNISTDSNAVRRGKTSPKKAKDIHEQSS